MEWWNLDLHIAGFGFQIAELKPEIVFPLVFLYLSLGDCFVAKAPRNDRIKTMDSCWSLSRT